MNTKVISEKNLKVKPNKVEEVLKKKNVKTDSFAIFEYLNNQFKVILGEKFLIPYTKTIKKDETIIFDNVLMTHDLVGSPYLKNFVVFAKCLQPEFKDKKIIVFKYKSKKNYRVKTGHRQKYTLLEVIKFQSDYLPQKTSKKGEKNEIK